MKFIFIGRSYLANTVSANNSLLADTVSANNSLLADTLSVPVFEWEDHQQKSFLFFQHGVRKSLILAENQYLCLHKELRGYYIKIIIFTTHMGISIVLLV